MLLTNCSACSVLGLTVHGSSDMALVEYGGVGANVWWGNRVVRDPATRGLLASNADVFQSSGVERGPLVESNELTFAGDACLNQHNYFSVALRPGRSPAVGAWLGWFHFHEYKAKLSICQSVLAALQYSLRSNPIFYFSQVNLMQYRKKITFVLVW